MPLLGSREKTELEALILDRLTAQVDSAGPQSLLRPGSCVVVRANGVSIAATTAGASGALASVELRTLFTAVCHLASEGTEPLPRDSLPTLAKEAAAATAQQINRIKPD